MHTFVLSKVQHVFNVYLEFIQDPELYHRIKHMPVRLKDFRIDRVSNNAIQLLGLSRLCSGLGAQKSDACCREDRVTPIWLLAQVGKR